MSSSKKDIKIAVVGGGLGGICTAIVLGRAGYDVHLFEQAPKFGEIGAGVALGPNSVKAIKKMGLYEEYAKVADLTEPNAIWFSFLTWNEGKKIAEARSKDPHSSVHRAHALEAFLKCLPSNVTKHFGSHVNNIENAPNGVVLHIASPDVHAHPDWPSEQTVFEASVAIGCDGVKSATRTSLKELSGHGGGNVRYTGTYAYRGLLDMSAAVQQVGESAREPVMWLAQGKHILAFPIEGGTVLNIVAFVSDRSQPADERKWEGSWVKPVSHEKMLNDFAGWHENVGKLLKLIKKPEQWALHEVTPLDRWTVDRITLLGDSAHASLPHNGAGAGQATEDAYVLGQLLSHPECTAETIPAFLQAYEDVRRERASKQQIHSRESGEIYEFESSMGSNFDELEKHLKTRYEWIWDHKLDEDVEAANEIVAFKLRSS